MALGHLIGALFLYGFVCFFALFVCFIYHEAPTVSFPESFVKIGIDLAEISRILKKVYLFVWLFICVWICLFFVLIIVGHPYDVSLKFL